MARASTRMVKFVRALVDGAVAGGSPETGWTVAAFGSQLQVSGEEAAGLVHSGVLEADGLGMRARPEAAAWTRRALLPEDAHSSQHRETVALSGGAVMNLLERAPCCDFPVRRRVRRTPSSMPPKWRQANGCGSCAKGPNSGRG